jgi:hypothetical protein
LRKGLADIVFKVGSVASLYHLLNIQIVRHFQRLRGATQYKDVEAIDKDLKAFIAALPPAFRMLTYDASYDDKREC